MKNQEAIQEIDRSLANGPNAQDMYSLSLESICKLWDVCPDLPVHDTTFGHIAQSLRMMYSDGQFPLQTLNEARGELLVAYTKE